MHLTIVLITDVNEHEIQLKNELVIKINKV